MPDIDSVGAYEAEADPAARGAAPPPAPPEPGETATPMATLPATVPQFDTQAQQTMPVADRGLPKESFGHKLYHGILNALGGSQDISFNRDATGKMVMTTTPSTPGSQWKRIISGALTGFAGAQAAGTQGPGGAMRGLAGGIKAGAALRERTEDKLRGEADEDYKTQLEKAKSDLNSSLINQQMIESQFRLQDMNNQATDRAIQMRNTMTKLVEDAGGSLEHIGMFATPQDAYKFVNQYPEVMNHHATGNVLPVPNISKDGKYQGFDAYIVKPGFKQSPTTRDYQFEIPGMPPNADGTKPKITVPAGSQMQTVLDMFTTLQKEGNQEDIKKLLADAAQDRADAAKRAADAAVDRANRPEKPEKPLRMAVPDGKGGMMLRDFGPGDTIPAGAVTPAGMSSLSVPPAMVRTMVAKAPRVIDFVDRINQLIDVNEKQLGPMQGRWSEFTAGKIGVKNQDYTKLRTDLGLLETALMNMHVGARGGTEIMKHFHDLIDGAKQDPDNLRAALGEIKDYAQRIQQEGVAAGGAAPQAGPTPNQPTPPKEGDTKTNSAGDPIKFHNGAWGPA